MKLISKKQFPAFSQSTSAYTLVEILVAVGIYAGLFVAAMVMIQIFSMRLYTLTATKLSATAGARKTLAQVSDAIREAKSLQIGNCGAGPSTFVATLTTNPAVGNALQIFPTTNQNSYSIYYLDTNTTPGTNSLMLYSTTNNGTGYFQSMILASYITNNIIFDAEDYQGNILTNNPKNNQVYRLTLQFSQWEYPIASVGNGPGVQYDYYQLRTRICRRALN